MPSTDDPSTCPAPTVVVRFGATGDLSRRMVIPALFELHRSGLAPELVAPTGRFSERSTGTAPAGG